MLIAKLIYAVCFIIMGLLFVIMGIASELPAYFVLIGLGGLAWGIYDIRKYIQEKRKEGEIDDMAKERADIADKLKDKE